MIVNDVVARNCLYHDFKFGGFAISNFQAMCL